MAARSCVNDGHDGIISGGRSGMLSPPLYTYIYIHSRRPLAYPCGLNDFGKCTCVLPRESWYLCPPHVFFYCISLCVIFSLSLFIWAQSLLVLPDQSPVHPYIHPYIHIAIIHDPHLSPLLSSLSLSFHTHRSMPRVHI